MNFKITPEILEKAHNLIYRYIDNSIDIDNVNMTNPYVVNFETDEEYEDPNMEIYYLGDWLGEEHSDKLFTYYHPEYFDSDSPSEKSFRNRAPILEINDEMLIDKLDGFGHKLYSPVISKWFEDKFKLPVKSVTTYY